MNNFRALSLAVACAAALFAAPAAEAAGMVLCAPPVSGALPGPQRVVNPNSGGGTYSLGNRGCALMAQSDIGYFQSQGYTQGGNSTSIIYTSGVQASGTGALVIGNIPAGAYIQHIVIQETAGAAVTGGIDIGTAANGQQVVAALAITASLLTDVTDALTVKRVFSTTVSTPLYLAAHTGWNGANLTVTVIYGYF